MQTPNVCLQNPSSNTPLPPLLSLFLEDMICHGLKVDIFSSTHGETRPDSNSILGVAQCGSLPRFQDFISEKRKNLNSSFVQQFRERGLSGYASLMVFNNVYEFSRSSMYEMEWHFHAIVRLKAEADTSATLTHGAIISDRISPERSYSIAVEMSRGTRLRLCGCKRL